MSTKRQAGLVKKMLAEALGTAFLLTAVVGSGIMAFQLAEGNGALALLCNSVVTGAALIVLISIFGPISGAHFNPAVSAVMALRGDRQIGEMLGYAVAQVAGGLFGVLIAHAMFSQSILQISGTERSGHGLFIAEVVATLGLLLTILLTMKRDAVHVARNVGLYIMAAYWFTASTSFANPAASIARALTDTYAGICPEDVPAFIVAQMMGALLAVPIERALDEGA
jgi:glycerol uptake facilitator-like aquaporin